jgi:Xaa-Pro aminopeptidase
MEDLGDRAGYGPEAQRADHPAFRALRLNRVLEPDMVVTIEPGLYFSPLLLRRAKEDRTIARQIRWAEVERFRSVRGIRIEDDVLVTDEDPVILSASAPKSVAEIEACLGA